MGYREFSFEGLEAYKAARVLVRDINRLQQKFPKTEIMLLVTKLDALHFL